MSRYTPPNEFKVRDLERQASQVILPVGDEAIMERFLHVLEVVPSSSEDRWVQLALADPNHRRAATIRRIWVEETWEVDPPLERRITPPKRHFRGRRAQAR